MSFDPKDNMPAMGSVPPKKSGALKWILGGLGCIGLLIALCIGGSVYMTYRGVQMVTSNPAYLEARATLESSEALGNAVGNPVTVGEPVNIQTTQGERIGFTYQVPVSGPNGSGTAEISVNGKPFSEDWKLESLKVTVDGEEVPLDGSSIEPMIEGE